MSANAKPVRVTARAPAVQRARHRFAWLRPGLVVAVSLLIYPNVFLLPSTPFLLTGDQVFFWTYAQRMLHGERPYRDFFQFTPPGTDLVYLSVFRLFGARIVTTCLVDFGLGLALALACFRAAREVMAERSAAVVTVAFVAALYVPLTNGTHHVFSLLFIMGALVVVMHGPTARGLWLASGVLAVASFFTHTHGAAALIALLAWAVWQWRASGASWRASLGVTGVAFATYLVSLAALYAYFLATVGGRRLWECEVAFVSKFMVAQPTPIPGLPEPITWHRLERFVTSCMLPLVYPVALAIAWRARAPSREARNAALMAMVGLALSLEVSLSPSWLRYYAVAMPAVIVAGWLADRCGRWKPLALGGGLSLALYVAGVHTLRRQGAGYIVRNLPAGVAAVPAATDEKLEFIRRRTAPGEFFLQAIWPGLYVPLGLRSPLYVDTLGADDATRPEWAARAIVELEAKAVRYILWSPRLDGPGPEGEAGYHLGGLRDYVHARYRRVETLADGEEVWERVGAL